MALGKRTSVYLTSDLDARWRKAGVPLATLVREALDARELPPAESPPTLEDIRGVVREELDALPAPVCRAQSGYEHGGYSGEAYLSDP
jgi:hypothetical protein